MPSLSRRQAVRACSLALLPLSATTTSAQGAPIKLALIESLSGSFATPQPSFRFETGLWLAAVPVRAKISISSSVRCTQWAASTSASKKPSASRCLAGVLPYCSVICSTSARDSATCM